MILRTYVAEGAGVDLFSLAKKYLVFSMVLEFALTKIELTLWHICGTLVLQNRNRRCFRPCIIIIQLLSNAWIVKWYATEIYRSNGYDIALVQRLLQHSSAATTQRYIGIEPQRIEKAIEGHAELI